MNQLESINIEELRNTNGGGGSMYETVVGEFAKACADFTAQVIKDVQTSMAANAESAKQKEITEDIACRKLLH